MIEGNEKNAQARRMEEKQVESFVGGQLSTEMLLDELENSLSLGLNMKWPETRMP